MDDLVARVAACCDGLPGAEVRTSHGSPAWFAGRQFLHLWPEGHHDRPEPQLWCAAPAGEQEVAVAADPQRCFRPPYVGPRGWIGVVLDDATDWDEVAAMVVEAWRTVAPVSARRAFDATAGEQR